MSSTIQLVPEDCHNYKFFCKQGRCPLVSVCNEDCMFVWKAYYDGTKELPQDEEIENLKDKIEDLEIDITNLEVQLNIADEKIEQLEAELNGGGE
jgi:hypothetical protein